MGRKPPCKEAPPLKSVPEPYTQLHNREQIAGRRIFRPEFRHIWFEILLSGYCSTQRSAKSGGNPSKNLSETIHPRILSFPHAFLSNFHYMVLLYARPGQKFVKGRCGNLTCFRRNSHPYAKLKNTVCFCFKNYVIFSIDFAGEKWYYMICMYIYIRVDKTFLSEK